MRGGRGGRPFFQKLPRLGAGRTVGLEGDFLQKSQDLFSDGTQTKHQEQQLHKTRLSWGPRVHTRRSPSQERTWEAGGRQPHSIPPEPGQPVSGSPQPRGSQQRTPAKAARKPAP